MTESSLVQHPWANTNLSPTERARHLLSAMTFDDKVNLVMGNTETLGHLGIPSMARVDASCGLRGDTGVTAFPVPIALAATFNTDLAYAYGAAIAEEARAHGWSVILGPTLDVERRGNSGRLTEGYGEDPLLNGTIGERVSRGMIDQHVITCLKHFTAYNQETERTSVNVHVSDRVLHEIYNAPFHWVIKHDSAPSMMGAYPKINGTFACENAAIWDALRSETGWPGFAMSDFMAGQDPVAGFNAAMDSTTLYPDFPRDAFSDGRISAERLDQAVQRTLYSIFKVGLYDHPVGKIDQHKMVSTPEHKAIARQTAEESIVLLKNDDNIMPLSAESIGKLAIIGCVNRDGLTGVEGSTYVIPGDYATIRDAITSRAGHEIQITFAQGSSGDHPHPIVPSTSLMTPDGSTPGLLGTYYDNADFNGAPVTVKVDPTLDLSGTPIDALSTSWSVRWTGKITSPSSGRVNFSVLCSGTVTLFVDGQCVLSGSRDSINFVTGSCYYPLHGSMEMRANQSVKITVEFSTPYNSFDGFMGKQFHLGWQTESLIPAAVESAGQADIAIVVVNQTSGEGMDRDTFSLPGDQDRLIEAVAEANWNTIVVLNTSGAVLMPWLDKVAAVLQVWYPGEAIGTAIAAVLLGDAEPGGRLPVTIPADENQAIQAYTGSGSVDFVEDVFVGYRYYERQGHTSLFPFGYGLSYTEFEYGDLHIQSLDDDLNVGLVRVTVRNIGERPGSDVVQVYVGELPVPVPTPSKQLAGFAKVTLSPKEATTIEITIPRRIVSYWDDSGKMWQISRGTITVFVGNSSVDDRLTGYWKSAAAKTD